MNISKSLRRTRYLKLSMALSLVFTLLAAGYSYGLQTAPVSAASLAQASTCPAILTPAVTEGPYYKAGSPARSSLIESGTTGTKLSLSGYVYDKNCQPIGNAWLDFWQADASGSYDNSGYKLRGHVYTDAMGRFQIETIVPGEYPGRTEHIHVKVQSPNGPILTTQLFIPGVAHNSTDSIYDPALLMNVQDAAIGKIATYNFKLNVTTTSSTQTTPVAQATPTAIVASSSHTFTETGFTISGDFWTVWQNGRSYADSLFINGLPISAVRNEVSSTDGKTYQTEWFERARFEYHPENKAPYNVLLGLLGTDSVQNRHSEAPFKAIANPGGGLQFFSLTGHTVGDSSVGGKAIASYWARSGGITQFGYPLSQPFVEKSATTARPTLCNTSSDRGLSTTLRTRTPLTKSCWVASALSR